MPPLFEQILEEPADTDSDADAQWVRLEEWPEVRAAYEEYVERQWLPWPERDRLLQQQLRI